MKSLAVSAPDYAASMFSTPSFLRIAIPSWRSIGIQHVPEPESDVSALSREELQNLFQGELNGKSRKKSAYTATEERERSLAKRIRQALYPSGERTRH